MDKAFDILTELVSDPYIGLDGDWQDADVYMYTCRYCLVEWQGEDGELFPHTSKCAVTQGRKLVNRAEGKV